MAHYARGVAYAVQGKLEEAEAERRKFYEALDNKALENRYIPIHRAGSVGKAGWAMAHPIFGLTYTICHIHSLASLI